MLANASSAALPMPVMAANVFGPRTPVALGMSAIHQRAEVRSLSDVKRAHAFRPAKFVRGNRQQAHAQLVHVDGNFPRGLYCVAVEHDSLFSGDFGNLFNGLNRSRFVICKHDTDEYSFRTNRAADIFRSHKSIAIYGQIVRSIPPFASALNGSSTATCSIAEVITCLDLPVAAATATENRVIAGLRASAGEHDFRGARDQQGGD